MSNTPKSLRACIVIVLFCSLVGAQSTNSTQSPVVPQLVKFSGKAVDEQGKPVSGSVGLTFAICSAQRGGSPLWMENQNVAADAKGNYTVELGSTRADGLPLELFSSGEARWVGVRVNGGEEQPRVLLLSVPYALKAADAQTLGGLPASAFVLAAPPNSGSSPAPSSNVNSDSNPPSSGVTGSGTADYVPLWTSSSNIGNSVLYQSGTGSKAKIGINTAKPASTLDVHGTGTIRGLFSLPATGTATSSGGFDSQPVDLAASVFNSSTETVVPQTSQWQAEPVNNNTSNASGSLNLLFAQGGGKPAETGLNIASNGQITFATGQTFPGAGTITGITTASGSGLSGGGNSGNLSLGLVNTCATNQLLQWNGSAWVCTNPSTGTVISVGLSAPSSDFTVSGSPVTSSGTLRLSWTVAPTPSDTANAIVKRDANGSFSAGPISTTASSSNAAIIGTDTSGAGMGGVVGTSTNGYGVSATGYAGLNAQGTESFGLYANGPSGGVYATGTTGVVGYGTTGVYGGGSTYGVQGYSSSQIGVYGEGATGVYVRLLMREASWDRLARILVRSRRSRMISQGT